MKAGAAHQLISVVLVVSIVILAAMLNMHLAAATENRRNRRPQFKKIWREKRTCKTNFKSPISFSIAAISSADLPVEEKPPNEFPNPCCCRALNSALNAAASSSAY